MDTRSGKCTLLMLFCRLGRIAVGLLVLTSCGTQVVAPPEQPNVQESDEPSQHDPSQNELGSESATVAGCLSTDSTQDDPAKDGWSTEVFSAAAAKRLKNLFHSVEDSEASVKNILAENASAPILPPSSMTVTKRQSVAVSRWIAGTNKDCRTGTPKDLLDSLQAWSAPSKPTTKTKITRVEFSETEPHCTVLLSITGDSESRNVQCSATLDCGWIVSDNQLLLSSLRLLEYEQVELTPGAWFRECTPSMMKEVTAYQEQLGYSCDYWAKRVERRLGTNFMGYHGVSLGDVNGDLLDDIYLCQPGGNPNRLLLQNPDGTLQDVSKLSNLDILDSCRCALFLDFDNDGDQDIAIASITGTLFFENDGKGAFEFRHRFAESKLGYSLAAADFDADGDLDVYACCYHAPAKAEFGNPMPYHEASNGSPNFLLRNDGDFQFRDVTTDVGLNQDNTRWSYAACWEDYDNDGDPDLYVANDFGRNCLYENNDGKFANVAGTAGVEDTASGMSTSWADFNGDGWMDIYVSNMFSSAGGRITYQNQFKQQSSDGTKQKLRRLARGNSLFANNGDGTFSDVTLSANVEMGRWSWGSNFVDLNNDGFEDLMVANGNYTGEDSGDL